MALIGIVIVALLLVSGLVLLGIGVRGRLMSTHPHCRRCRFDLVGQATADGVWAGRVCPECGADLGDSGAIRSGLRARRRLPMWCGAGMLLLAGAVAATVVWGQRQGKGLYSHLPTWVILRVMDHVQGDELDLIGVELRARAKAGELSTGQSNTVVAACLRAQADASRTWACECGKFIEDAHAAGTCRDADWNTYLDHAETLALTVREAIASGDPLPMRMALENRLGRTGQVQIRVWLIDVIVDGKRIDGLRHDMCVTPREGPWNPPSPVPDQIRTTAQSFSIFSWGPWSAPPSGWHEAPVMGEIGMHTVETAWAVVAGPIPAGQARHGWGSTTFDPGHQFKRPSDAQVLHRCKLETKRDRSFSYDDDNFKESDDELPEFRAKMVRLSSQIEIVDHDSQRPRMVVAPTEAGNIVKGFTAEWRSEPWLTNQVGPPHPQPRLTLSAQQPFVAVAGDVFELTAEGETRLGSVAIDKSDVSPGTNFSQGATFPLPLATEWSKPRTFVFRPSPAAAQQLLRSDEILGSEVVFRDLPAPEVSVTWSPQQNQKPGEVVAKPEQKTRP